MVLSLSGLFCYLFGMPSVVPTPGDSLGSVVTITPPPQKKARVPTDCPQAGIMVGQGVGIGVLSTDDGSRGTCSPVE